MSHQLATCLIAVAVNLAGMLLLYAVMSHLLARLAWTGHGVFGVLGTIVVAQLFWIALTLVVVALRDPGSSAAWGLWFGNWLVSGFGVVLLSRTARSIPRQLEDSARLDSLGAMGTWRHAVFPFVRRDLGLLALFTVIATLLSSWALINLPDAGNSIVPFQRTSTPAQQIGLMLAGSLVGAFLVIAIFFLAKRPPAVQ